jgi:hypothetical protein
MPDKAASSYSKGWSNAWACRPQDLLPPLAPADFPTNFLAQDGHRRQPHRRQVHATAVAAAATARTRAPPTRASHHTIRQVRGTGKAETVTHWITSIAVTSLIKLPLIDTSRGTA